MIWHPGTHSAYSTGPNRKTSHRRETRPPPIAASADAAAG